MAARLASARLTCRPRSWLAAVCGLLLLPSLAAAQPTCAVDGDCGETTLCQTARCIDGACAIAQTDVCDDDNPCTSDQCIQDTDGTFTVVHCIWRHVADGTACGDAAVCSGEATCRSGDCLPGEPAPRGTACPDGNLCNGDEQCDGNGLCAATPPTPCEDPGACASATCDPTLGCVVDDAPRTGCTEAGSGSLLVDERIPGKEKLSVRLAESGPPYGQIEWGDPTGASGVTYELCVFDQNGDLAGGVEIDRGGDTCGGKPCWTSVAGSPPGGRRFLYRDPERSTAGVSRVLLRSARERGHQAVTTLKAGNDVKRGYATLPLGIAGALAGDTSATVQLSGSDGRCLEGALVGTSAGGRYRGAVD